MTDFGKGVKPFAAWRKNPRMFEALVCCSHRGGRHIEPDVELLSEAAERVAKRQPGYARANVLRWLERGHRGLWADEWAAPGRLKWGEVAHPPCPTELAYWHDFLQLVPVPPALGEDRFIAEVKLRCWQHLVRDAWAGELPDPIHSAGMREYPALSDRLAVMRTEERDRRVERLAKGQAERLRLVEAAMGLVPMVNLFCDWAVEDDCEAQVGDSELVRAWS